MYTAIIVDDEKKICQLIQKLGDWQRLQIEVLAVCTDGEEALAAIQELKPDIVLTDVRMPVYDGLELIRRSREQGLHPAFIIISGYKYFEYAYHAFKYGVIDYLLKPIEKEQLNEVLEKTCQILDQRRQFVTAENELRRLSRHMELNNRRKMFLQLFDDGAHFPDTPEELEEIYHKTFPYPAFQVLFVRTDRDLQDSDSFRLAQKIQDAARKIFSGCPERADGGRVFLCSETIHTGFAAILNFPPEKAGRVKNMTQTFYYDVCELVQMFGGSRAAVGAGIVVQSLKELPEAARTAEEAEAARVVYGTGRVLSAGELHFSPVTFSQALPERERRSLKNAVETLREDQLALWLDHVREMFSCQPPLSPQVLFALQDLLGEELLRYAKMQDREEDFVRSRREWFWESGHAAGYQEFFACLRKGALGQLARWRSEKEREEKLPIRLAKAYIAEHFGEAVTLEQVAEQVGLSPSYFSTNFRKVEGRTFSEYLTAVRMEEAKELLAETKATNYEIASRIGYADEKYFGKVFKKEVGIRPGEYRKLYYRK